MTDELKTCIEQINNDKVPVRYKKTKVGIIPSEWGVCSINNKVIKEMIDDSDDIKNVDMSYVRITIALKNDAYMQVLLW